MEITKTDSSSHECEQLLLEGYRHWCCGIIYRDHSYWEKVWNIFANKFGAENGKLVVDALVKFTKTLRECSRCSLNTNYIGCEALCRDEILILGLISGLQHEEETVITLCLDGLTCPTRCSEVLNSAETLATVMRMVGNLLLPIPANSIKAILTDNSSSPTLH